MARRRMDGIFHDSAPPHTVSGGCLHFKLSFQQQIFQVTGHHL